MTVGIIGGSGIYESIGVEVERRESVSTPFGEPSAPVTIGELGDEEVAFLPRHGEDHQYSPTETPYRANVYALKSVGVDRVIATNAVGSLREDLPPRTLLVPNQIVDRTRHRPETFFEDGVVVHMGIAEPFCGAMRSHLLETADRETDLQVRDGGAYVCIEGPQYSTRAESEFYRDQGWDVVGMTTTPEAKLAREAELSYATIAGITDYDVWKDDEEVTLETVLENAAANEDAMQTLIEAAVRSMPADFESEAWSALEGTINTAEEAIPPSKREELDLLLEEYLD